MSDRDYLVFNLLATFAALALARFSFGEALSAIGDMLKHCDEAEPLPSPAVRWRVERGAQLTRPGGSQHE
jgi:hypothetical protein